MSEKDVPIDLASLMQQVQAGDQAAYKKLFDEVGALIMRVIRQRIQDTHAAEDIYQTILMTIHRARHTYDPTRPFKPWLYSITRNTIFDHLRKVRRRNAHESTMHENFEATAKQDTSIEEIQLLKKALNTLPENQREAVQLLKIEGLSLQEASKKTGVSVGAIKVRAHRGYESIKKVLSGKTEGSL